MESLRAIATNKAMYSLSGAARLISGITLMAGALYLVEDLDRSRGIWDALCPHFVCSLGRVHRCIRRVRTLAGHDRDP